MYAEELEPKRKTDFTKKTERMKVPPQEPQILLRLLIGKLELLAYYRFSSYLFRLLCFM